MPKPPTHEIYHINHALVGVHTENPDQLTFTSLSTSVADLETFVGVSPFQQPELPTPESYGVVYKPIDPICCSIPSKNLDVSIVTNGGYEYSRDENQHCVSYRCSIELKLYHAVSYEAATDLVQSISRFLALCLRESVSRRYIRGTLSTGDFVAEYGQPLSKPVRPGNRDWLLTLAEIGPEKLGDVLAAWFALLKKLGFIAPVFFSELSSPSRINDARFFHFAGCLESFHREVVRPKIGKFIPKAEYRKIAEEMMKHAPSGIADDLRSSIRSAISRANDQSFGERLDELFNGLEPETQTMLANEPQRFLAAVKHTRNKLAHVTDEPDRETFEGVQFAHANLSIRGWLRILLLRACGISEGLIRSRMESINYFYWGPFDFEAPAERVRGRF